MPDRNIREDNYILVKTGRGSGLGVKIADLINKNEFCFLSLWISDLPGLHGHFWRSNLFDKIKKNIPSY